MRISSIEKVEDWQFFAKDGSGPDVHNLTMSTTNASEVIIKWLNESLEKAGMNQSDLARAIGLTSQKVNRIINGGREMTAEELIRISASLNAPIPSLGSTTPIQPIASEQTPTTIKPEDKSDKKFQDDYDRAFAVALEIEKSEFGGEMPLEDFVAALTIGLKRQRRY